jgi:hypothetical protein
MIKLITIDDIRELKPQTANADVAKKIDPFIIEAQEFEFQPMIGDEFYLDILEDAGNSFTKYNFLWSGGEYIYGKYKYNNPGFKKMLIYYAYARIIEASNTNSTAFGTVQKLNQHSTQVSTKQIGIMVAQARSGAKAYENKVIDYLNRFENDYPLYRCYRDNKKFPGFRISGVRKK